MAWLRFALSPFRPRAMSYAYHARRSEVKPTAVLSGVSAEPPTHFGTCFLCFLRTQPITRGDNFNRLDKIVGKPEHNVQ